MVFITVSCQNLKIFVHFELIWGAKLWGAKLWEAKFRGGRNYGTKIEIVPNSASHKFAT